MKVKYLPNSCALNTVHKIFDMFPNVVEDFKWTAM